MTDLRAEKERLERALQSGWTWAKYQQSLDTRPLICENCGGEFAQKPGKFRPRFCGRKCQLAALDRRRGKWTGTTRVAREADR